MTTFPLSFPCEDEGRCLPLDKSSVVEPSSGDATASSDAAAVDLAREVVELTEGDLSIPLGKFELCLLALGVVLAEEVGDAPLGVLGVTGGRGKAL